MPFGSVSATKSFGKALTFYRRGNRQKVKSWGAPTGAPSAAQLAQRADIKLRVDTWRALSAEDKASWNNQAKILGDPWSGYTLFVSTWEAILNFTELVDTFSSYVGQAGKSVRVNLAENGLEPAEPGNIFLDEFNDESLHWAWRAHNTNAGKTITEAAGILTIAATAGTNADYWTGTNNAPKVITGLRGFPCEIITKINEMTVPGSTGAGMFVGYDAIGSGGSSIAFFLMYTTQFGIGVNGTPLDAIDHFGFPVWLRLRLIDPAAGSRGGRIIFGYSMDGVTYTDLYTYDAYIYELKSCGLFIKNWGAFPAISAPFEFFKINEHPGPG